MLDYETQRRIELFLFEEARLLDAGQFERWLTLHEPQGIYWMLAYDGFVINRRLNDLRDIERLSDAMCGILLKSARKPTHNVKEGVVIHPGAVQN